MLENYNKKYIESLLSKDMDWKENMCNIFDDIFDSEAYISLKNFIDNEENDDSNYYKVSHKELYGLQVTSDLGERRMYDEIILRIEDKKAKFCQEVYKICDKVYEIFLDYKLSNLPDYNTFKKFCQDAVGFSD